MVTGFGKERENHDLEHSRAFTFSFNYCLANPLANSFQLHLQGINWRRKMRPGWGRRWGGVIRCLPGSRGCAWRGVAWRARALCGRAVRAWGVWARTVLARLLLSGGLFSWQEEEPAALSGPRLVPAPAPGTYLLLWVSVWSMALRRRRRGSDPAEAAGAEGVVGSQYFLLQPFQSI